MSAEGPVRVVLVDDHPVVRAGLRAMLDGADGIEVLGEAGDGDAGVAEASRSRPDVVLMDLQMPGIDGVEATRRLRALPDPPQVLIVTTYDTDADILRAVEAGAIGYLLKDSPPEELFRAVRQAGAGQAVFGPGVATRLLGQMRTAGGEALTARETEIVALVARGLSNRQVAAELFLSEATVKTHLVHIFDKLGVDSRTAAVATAVERGIIRMR